MLKFLICSFIYFFVLEKYTQFKDITIILMYQYKGYKFGFNVLNLNGRNYIRLRYLVSWMDVVKVVIFYINDSAMSCLTNF